MALEVRIEDLDDPTDKRVAVCINMITGDKSKDGSNKIYFKAYGRTRKTFIKELKEFVDKINALKIEQGTKDRFGYIYTPQKVEPLWKCKESLGVISVKDHSHSEGFHFFIRSLNQALSGWWIKDDEDNYKE